MIGSTIRYRPFSTQSPEKDVNEVETLSFPVKCKGRVRAFPDRPATWSPVLSGSVWILIFSFYAILLLYIHATVFRYPGPIAEANARPGEFVEERARKHLDDLTSFGSRPVGSIANEELTVKYLLDEIEKIQKTMEVSVHKLEVDVQRVSGSFSLDFLGQFTSCYENVNNVIVRLSPKYGSNHSLLINCHYDTSMNTTGASDDTVSCCVMLEMLRVMSRNGVPYMHSIIFIFNGAEENILQASHGFITQHQWAKEIKAFVNLEAAGAGSKQLVFQSGPEHPWLIRTYAEHAPHPFASVVGQEVFQSGLVPSDTDFRIYRDYGGLPGLDLAYIYNGYVYHTEFDRPEMIPPGTIQQAGENMLAVIGAIANSPLLADPSDYRHGALVFFDFLGHFMIVYPMRIGTIINTVFVLAVVMWVGGKLLRRGSGTDTSVELSGYRGTSYGKQFGLAVFVLIVSWLVAVCCVAVIALFLDWAGHAMSWYTNMWLVFGVFVAPAVCAVMLTASAAKKLFYKNTSNSVWDIEAVYFDVALVFNAVLLAVLTYYELGSAIMALLPVLFPTVIRLGAVQLFKLSPNDHQRTFVTVHLISQLIPNLLFIWLVYGMLIMFVPIMGRCGDTTIPDLVVGGACVFAVIVLLMWQMGLMFATRSMRWIINGLLAVFVVSLIAVTCTSVGFPYSANAANPTKQRLIFHHLERNFRDINGNITHTDSGILFIPFDRNGDLLSSSSTALRNAKSAECSDMPYCGWPYYIAMIAFLKVESMKYKPAPRLTAVEKPQLILLNRTILEPNRQRITFSVEGPNHVNIYLLPKPDVELVGWSVGNGHPQPTMMPSYVDRPHYFIFYSYGSKPEKPFELSIDVQTKPETPESSFSSGVIDIALGGHYIIVDGKPFMTPELSDLVDSLPDWTTSLAWAATYDAWVL